MGVPTKAGLPCVTRVTRPKDSMTTVTSPPPRVPPRDPQVDALNAAMPSWTLARWTSNGGAAAVPGGAWGFTIGEAAAGGLATGGAAAGGADAAGGGAAGGGAGGGD